VGGHHAAFGHGTDAHRQVAAKPVDDIAPAGLVERFAMRGEHCSSVVDVGVGDRPCQRVLEDRLQAEEHRAIVQAAT
jgi:hypothetical protein